MLVHDECTSTSKWSHEYIYSSILSFVLVFRFPNDVEGPFVSRVGARAFIYDIFTALNVEIYEIFHSEIHKYIYIYIYIYIHTNIA
jgi:hypothetical protein